MLRAGSVASWLLVAGYYSLVVVNAVIAVVVVVTGSAIAASASQSAEARQAWAAAAHDLLEFYQAFWFFAVQGGSLTDCPFLQPTSSTSASATSGSTDSMRSAAALRQARVQVYSLALIFRLWSLPHYRSGTFQNDMVKNLRNVAIPGTGIPLSILCYTRATALWAVLVLNPIVCFIAALNVARSKGSLATAASAFREQLLAPQDWFSFWRLNCRLATYHAYVTGSRDYEQEDKQVFLDAAKRLGVPVNPSLDMPALVVKHRNEEGGLGFQMFRNAVHGGDWIIQERIDNGPAIAALLPADAPLSTLRIITASSVGLRASARKAGEADITPLSCVFRAGRAGAITDHQSILFDCDLATGRIRKGTTNAHWYRLGLDKVLTTAWTSEHDQTHHPDCGAPITGATIPDMASIRALVCDAHRRLCPHVPLVGWDVAITRHHGNVLLEGNFSCNFFRGIFDKPAYFALLERYFMDLDAAWTEQGGRRGRDVLDVDSSPATDAATAADAAADCDARGDSSSSLRCRASPSAAAVSV